MRLLKKVKRGRAKAGFSVGGKITSDEPSPERGVRHVITGVALDHIMLTAKPANAKTFAVALAKAIEEIDADEVAKSDISKEETATSTRLMHRAPERSAQQDRRRLRRRFALALQGLSVTGSVQIRCGRVLISAALGSKNGASQARGSFFLLANKPHNGAHIESMGGFTVARKPDPPRSSVDGVKIKPEHVIRELERAEWLIGVGKEQIAEIDVWPSAIGTHFVISTLVMLGAIPEALDVLSEMDARYTFVFKNHAASLVAWQNARHDVAHVVDRLFRERAGRSAVSQIGSEEWLRIAIVTLKPPDDVIVRTGDLPELSLRDALNEIAEIIGEAREIDEGPPTIGSAKEMYEAATGAPAPEGAVTSEMLSAITGELINRLKRRW